MLLFVYLTPEADLAKYGFVVVEHRLNHVLL